MLNAKIMEFVIFNKMLAFVQTIISELHVSTIKPKFHKFFKKLT